MTELEQFIKIHKNTALIVMRKSGWYNKLDQDDIDEITMCGLWDVFQKHDPEKSSVGYFINMVISSYVLRIIRKKMKNYSIERPLGDYHYQPQEQAEEYFTETEWESIRPLMDGHNIQESAKLRGFSPHYYKILTNNLKVMDKKRVEMGK